LPPSKTKGLTPDMEGELRNRSKNGATPTMETTWIDIYKKLFPGTPTPSTGPCKLKIIFLVILNSDRRADITIDLINSHGSSGGIEEREEYIQYSEQVLPSLVNAELDATSHMPPEHRDLFISVMKSCQRKLPGMFPQARETSKARLASEDKSLESISELNETLTDTVTFSSPSAHRSFQPDSENVNYGSEHPSVPTPQLYEISTFPPDTRSAGHISSTDLWHDSAYGSSSGGSKSIHSHSGSDRLVNQCSSSYPPWDDVGFDIFSQFSGQQLMQPIPQTVRNSTTEFDYHWPSPAPMAGPDLERCPSGERRESTASNIVSGSGAMPQASSQICYEVFDRDILDFRR
jgi:hypothetical protein